MALHEPGPGVLGELALPGGSIPFDSGGSEHRLIIRVRVAVPKERHVGMSTNVVTVRVLLDASIRVIREVPHRSTGGLKTRDCRTLGVCSEKIKSDPRRDELGRLVIIISFGLELSGQRNLKQDRR